MTKLFLFAFAICTLQSGAAAASEATSDAVNFATNARFKLVQLVKLESEKKALYVVQDTQNRTFSVAECSLTSAKDEILATNPTCQLIVRDNVWNFAAELMFKEFDAAFARELSIQAKAFEQKWTISGSATRAAVGAAIGVGVGEALAIAVSRSREGWAVMHLIPRVALGVAGISFAIMEGVAFYGRRTSTVEEAVMKLKPSVTPAQATAISSDIYEMVKKSLIVAMAARPSA